MPYLVKACNMADLQGASLLRHGAMGQALPVTVSVGRELCLRREVGLVRRVEAGGLVGGWVQAITRGARGKLAPKHPSAD